MGIDVWEVIDAAATKPFGFMSFYPGPGLGGHCIPIDPFYLTWKAREVGKPTRFIELAGEINHAMPDYVVARTAAVLAKVKGLSEADFAGRFMLIYFGFTYCPDICPTEMQTFAEVMDRLGPLADRVQPILITIDPARDTAEHLAGYVALFHPRLVGLTGTDAQIAEVARAYRVYYAKTDAKDGGAYLMDHSAAVYLMGPDGRFATIFGRGVPADRMADQIRARIPAG
jgi:protein SCO1/2